MKEGEECGGFSDIIEVAETESLVPKILVDNIQVILFFTTDNKIHIKILVQIH